jgi:hypothetical protein
MTSLNERGKRSVGDNVVIIKAVTKRKIVVLFFWVITNHIILPKSKPGMV